MSSKTAMILIMISCQKNCKIKWSSVAYHNQCRMAEHNGPERTPGPTTYVVSHAYDMASTFYLFIIPAIENIILDMTNHDKSGGFSKIWRQLRRDDTPCSPGLRVKLTPLD